jgi:hypothetical protein
MINFTDMIINKQQIPHVQMELSNDMFTGSEVQIYNKGDVVYTGSIGNDKLNVQLDKPDEDLTSYDAIIQKGRFSYSFEFAVLSLDDFSPYIVCDIDFTVSATNFILYLTENLLKIKSIYRSSDVLKLLSTDYKIIYLTGRVRKYNKMTKMWLKKNNFPDGPLIARESYKMNILKFKTETLNGISKISKKGIGIGDLPSDIISYQNNGLVSIRIVRPFLYYSKHNEKCYYKNGCYMVKSWNGIEKLFDEKKWFI